MMVVRKFTESNSSYQLSDLTDRVSTIQDDLRLDGFGYLQISGCSVGTLLGSAVRKITDIEDGDNVEYNQRSLSATVSKARKEVAELREYASQLVQACASANILLDDIEAYEKERQ